MAMKLGNDVVLDEITAAVERGAQAAAERARRRDMFAAAALTGLASDRTIDGSWDDIAVYAVRAADALLARLDATAEAASASVPPAPVSRPPETQAMQRGWA